MKKPLREMLLKKRDSIDQRQKRIKEDAIKKRLFSTEYFKNAKTILFYASFKSEVDTMRCIAHALRSGKMVVLPLVDKVHKRLKLYEIKDLSELVPNYMGIPEPVATRSRSVKLSEIDLEIIPGIGFDLSGNRLGYGAGYYDRLLAYKKKKLSGLKRQAPAIALAFEEQIVERVPSESHDIKVDFIITDKRSITCKDYRH